MAGESRACQSRRKCIACAVHIGVVLWFTHGLVQMTEGQNYKEVLIPTRAGLYTRQMHTCAHKNTVHATDVRIMYSHALLNKVKHMRTYINLNTRTNTQTHTHTHTHTHTQHERTHTRTHACARARADTLF